MTDKIEDNELKKVSGGVIKKNKFYDELPYGYIFVSGIASCDNYDPKPGFEDPNTPNYKTCSTCKNMEYIKFLKEPLQKQVCEHSLNYIDNNI